jgi:hypothetical protein
MHLSCLRSRHIIHQEEELHRYVICLWTDLIMWKLPLILGRHACSIATEQLISSIPSELQPIRVHLSSQIYVRGVFLHIPSFMAPFCLAVMLYASARVALAHVLPRQLDVAFSDPAQGGGSWLDNTGNGLGEPMNVTHSFSGCHSSRATTIF